MQLIISKYGHLLLTAMGQTLLLALLSLFFASIIGMIFGLMSVLHNRACRIIARIFVDVIRGVPMIVLAYFIYFGFPYLMNNMLGFDFTLTALQAGTICLALNCGAYMAEIIRGGIQSVDPGQMEAARSLGLTYGVRAILSVIGFPELVNQAKNVVANTFMSFQTWGIVAIMYLVIILALSRSAKVLEKRLNRGRGHMPA